MNGKWKWTNPTKSKSIVITKKKLDVAIFPNIIINGCIVELVDKARNLGLTFNRYLTWTDHITSTVEKVYGMLRTLWVNQYYTPIKIRLILAKTYLLPT